MKVIASTIALLLPLAAWAADVSVPMLKQPVQKGEVIEAENIVTQQLPQAQVYASTITDAAQLVGLQAVRPLAAMTPINTLHVRVPPAIARNSAVTLRFVRGGVELTGKGQALEDAALGQSVRVLNPATRATLTGMAAEGNVVEIN